MSLDGQKILVTGATSGIGLATVRILGSLGAQTIVHGRNSECVEKTCEELHAKGLIRPMPMVCDLCDIEQTKIQFQSVVKRLDGLDGLVNNAGIMENAPIGMITDESIERQLDTNVSSVIRLTQLSARWFLKQHKGCIVNLSSIMGRYGNRGQMVYSATKAAVIGATLSAAKELGSRNIRVNCVAPGYIETKMTSSTPDKAKEESLARIPLGRLGSADEVAEVVAWLFSSSARYVHGQIIGVDGGMVV